MFVMRVVGYFCSIYIVVVSYWCACIMGFDFGSIYVYIINIILYVLFHYFFYLLNGFILDKIAISEAIITLKSFVISFLLVIITITVPKIASTLITFHILLKLNQLDLIILAYFFTSLFSFYLLFVSIFSPLHVYFYSHFSFPIIYFYFYLLTYSGLISILNSFYDAFLFIQLFILLFNAFELGLPIFDIYISNYIYINISKCKYYQLQIQFYILFAFVYFLNDYRLQLCCCAVGLN